MRGDVCGHVLSPPLSIRGSDENRQFLRNAWYTCAQLRYLVSHTWYTHIIFCRAWMFSGCKTAVNHLPNGRLYLATLILTITEIKATAITTDDVSVTYSLTFIRRIDFSRCRPILGMIQQCDVHMFAKMLEFFGVLCFINYYLVYLWVQGTWSRWADLSTRT